MRNKEAEMMWYLLAIILGVLIIFAIVYFLFIGNKTNWQFLKSLPVNYTDKDKLIKLTDLSEQELAALDCNAVGKINSDSYISIMEVKSKLFYDEGVIKLDIPGFFARDELVGKVISGKLIISNEFLETSRDFLEDESEEGVPSVDEFNLLNKAYLLYGTYFCKSNSQMEEYEKVKCNEKCSLYDGECSSKGYSIGRLSYGRLDCKEGEECFVEYAREKSENDKLKINKFDYAGKDNSEVFSFLNKDEVVLKTGDKGDILFSITNLGDSFCFVLRSNKQKLIHKLYNEKNVQENLYWTVGDEKTMEYVAWVPFEDKIIFKRIEVDSSITKREYLNEHIFTYEKFKEAVSKPGNSYGNYLIISTEAILIDDAAFFEFKFIGDIDNKVKVFARENEKDKWHRLDCYSDWFHIGFFDELDINVEDLKPSLKQTLEDCGLA